MICNNRKLPHAFSIKKDFVLIIIKLEEETEVLRTKKKFKWRKKSTAPQENLYAILFLHGQLSVEQWSSNYRMSNRNLSIIHHAETLSYAHCGVPYRHLLMLFAFKKRNSINGELLLFTDHNNLESTKQTIHCTIKIYWYNKLNNILTKSIPSKQVYFLCIFLSENEPISRALMIWWSDEEFMSDDLEWTCLLNPI